ncbi:MAG: hypothetical protein Q9162_007606 [Coniocarpon cinnabarinum]
MPELPEVHRATHFLRLYLLNSPHTLTRVSYYSPPDNKNAATITNDPKIFDTAKTGLDAGIFCKTLQGKNVKDVGRLGKYFWLEMDKPPHPVFHFGMTGWIKYKGSKGKGVDYWEGKVEGRNGEGANKKYTPKGRKEEKQGDGDSDPEAKFPTERPHEVPEEEWPPRFTKVLFEATSSSGEVTEFAFVDGRRFAKIQLIHPEAGKSVRETDPLSLNGPDPVLEADKITDEWLGGLLEKRKVPVKALLLDQHALSGVGNWVADEVLFQARIHPEKTANALDEDEVARLAEQLKSICRIAAIDALGDSNHFPADGPNAFLMRHRWRLDKTGNEGVLPSGEKIVRITVGGRTSAVVPSRQGYGPGATAEQQSEAGGGSSKKRKSTAEQKSEAPGRSSRKRKSSAAGIGDGSDDAEAAQKVEREEDDEDENEEEEQPTSAKRRSSRRTGTRNSSAKAGKQDVASETKKQKSSQRVSDTETQAMRGKRSSRGRRN